MKKILLLIFLLAGIAAASAKPFADETVTYKVMYKWGLINKQAGTVKINIQSTDNDRYLAQLTAASAPWADKLYMVRDTLQSEIIKDGFIPVRYQKFAHEGDDYNRDFVIYRPDAGTTVTADCSHTSYRNGKLRRQAETTLDAAGTTLDMLSAYYYMRQLPYQQWQPGHSTTLNIFSGRRKELLTIRYHGYETVESDGVEYPCHHITFIFTSDGKKKSSDDMSAWIDINTGIPVKLEGKLPVGSVRCYYVPNP